MTSQSYVSGFHIQVRDMSSQDNLYDVVTISGGGTRSHTLSDLRPATEYTVFILPYNGDVIGTPSNLKVVVTKEDGMCLCPEAIVTLTAVWKCGISEQGILKSPISHVLNFLGWIK